mmetsp:Transcript_20112/g.29850  ORF Transcript_20112/g.29850 Transcript_20112/m.29850 type:complete len:105 (+) Transcript_20112:92-406(+)
MLPKKTTMPPLTERTRSGGQLRTDSSEDGATNIRVPMRLPIRHLKTDLTLRSRRMPVLQVKGPKEWQIQYIALKKLRNDYHESARMPSRKQDQESESKRTAKNP